MAPADLDGDGDFDIATSNWTGGAVAWFENLGMPDDQAGWKKHPIDDTLGEARSIRAGDIDCDGDLDLVATGRTTRQIVWYENAGKAPAQSWPKHIIDEQTKHPSHGQPFDLDGDGDLDLVMACGFGPPLNDGSVAQKVVWYENHGQAIRGPWKQHFVAEVAQAFEAIAADLDGDGDIDVAATGWGSPGSIVWAENAGDPRGKWKTHVLKSPWGNANQVIAADFNGDRQLDLAACAERGALELRWWRNEGGNSTKMSNSLPTKNESPRLTGASGTAPRRGSGILVWYHANSPLPPRRSG